MTIDADCSGIIMVIDSRPALIFPRLRTRIALVLLRRKTTGSNCRSPVLVRRPGRVHWCHVLFESSCLLESWLAGGIGPRGTLVDLELRGRRVLLVQVVVRTCSTFSARFIQGLPGPG